MPNRNTNPIAPAIIPFDFEGMEVRVIDRSGEPWWVLIDVCSVLEIANSRDAATRLDDDEKGDVGIADAIGRDQKTTIINESGLWSLVLTSRKPAAKRFKKWITSEVIPSIRKTGGYMVAAPEETPEETPEELAIRAVIVLQATVARQKAALDEAAPQIDAYKALASLEGVHNIRWSAQQCGWPERKFSEKLCEIKWCYRHPVTGRLTVYRNTIDRGLMDTKNIEVKRTGHIEGVGQPMITQKGLAELRSMLGPYESNKRADAMNAEIATRSKKKATPVPFSQTPA